MLFADLPDLITLLKAAGKHITLETAGTLWLDGLPPAGIDLASTSLKIISTITKRWMNTLKQKPNSSLL